MGGASELVSGVAGKTHARIQMVHDESSGPRSDSEYETLLRTLATELACLCRESEERLGRCLARLNVEPRRIEKSKARRPGEVVR